MRVDAVITWVDGNDPVWRKKRAHYAGEDYVDPGLVTSNVEGRYRDNGELLYLLRSLERFWPFQGNIFLVTDGQRPDFLGNHPRVKVIDHKDFIEPQYLPTFSSRAIEASLHRIPGLSEHFVSFNDDLFLARHISFEDFFGSKGSRIYITEEEIPKFTGNDILSGQNDALNAHAWVIDNYGKSGLNHILEHAPKGIRKSWMLEIEKSFPEMFAQVRSEKFRQRTGQSILANVYPEWCMAMGRADVAKSQSLYLYSDHIEKEDQALQKVREAMHYCLSVCINDTTDNRSDLNAWHDRYHALMGDIFKNPCQFERTPQVKPQRDVEHSIR
jgi:hypothetical protein